MVQRVLIGYGLIFAASSIIHQPTTVRQTHTILRFSGWLELAVME